MTRTVVGALISVATLVFVVASIFGTLNQGSIVRYESSSRGAWPVFTMTHVTKAGRDAGLRPGDVLDFRLLTPLERYRFNLWGSGPVSGYNGGDDVTLGSVGAEQTFSLPYQRDGKIVRILRRTTSAPWNDRVSALVSDVLSVFSAIFGALLLLRGRDRASLLGGLFLEALAISGLPFMWGFNGFFAIGPLAVASWVVTVLTTALSLVLLYLFAESFVPVQVSPVALWAFRVLYAPNVILLAVFGYFEIRYMFVGDVDAQQSGLAFALAIAYILGFVVVLAAVWFASVEPRQRQPLTVRIIFWSLVVAFSGPTVDAVVTGLWNLSLPFDGALGLTIMVMPVAVAYVVFTKNVYDLDFFVSRAALYAILLGVIVAVIALTESFLDHVFLGRFGNIAVSFAIPILLGLSMRWIGGHIENGLQRTLYREKKAAHDRLLAMVEDFSEAHDPDALARHAIGEIYRTFKGACAIYRFDEGVYTPYAIHGFERAPEVVPQDDPAFMRLRRTHATVDVRGIETLLPRNGLLLPLTVVGRVHGGIYVGARPHSQWYDPDDQFVLRTIAAELAAALLWLKDEALRLPSPYVPVLPPA